jgi:choline dehydrogenase
MRWMTGRDMSEPADRQWDTIIAGGGAAGCVLAARLSEDPGRSVLLVDAGPDYGPDPDDWPSDLIDPYHSAVESHSWHFANVPTPGGFRASLPRARVLGGCSAVNACIWLRGSRVDYDDWAASGNPGWGYDDLLPFFKRAETDEGGATELHGHDGPVRVSRAAERDLSDTDRALLEAAAELGFDYIDDMNAMERQFPAIGPAPKNIVDGRRMNGTFTYLAQARGRSNLTILPDTLVDRVLVDGSTATGVHTVDGRDIRGREVILSAGSYASPSILMRSGIGPEEHLRSLGIAVTRDLPGVGENLLDHPFIAPYTSGLTIFPVTAGRETGRRSFIQVMIKARSQQVAEEIDLHLYPREVWDETTGRWMFGFGVSLQYARSKGYVRLTSADPEAPILIDHNYFSDPADLEAICDGLELVSRIITTPPLAAFVDVAGDAPIFSSREELRAIVREEIGTTFHPSTTCRMGPASDPGAVVDAECRVHGIDRLRVVDASIFPHGPRCNLHWPTIAAAERVAAIMQASPSGSRH